MQSSIFGKTTLGLPILSFEFGQKTSPAVLILGGTHGDEIEGVALAKHLLQVFDSNFGFRLHLIIIPEFNLDGVLNKTRTNANGVDLNRNLATKDWSAEIKNPRYPPGPFKNSEIENQSLVRFLDRSPQKFILNLHSYKPCLNTNGDCLVQADIAHRLTGYPIVDSIGYPTPGCLGTYAGLERAMPTLTYEIERGLAIDQILKLHTPAVIEILKSLER